MIGLGTIATLCARGREAADDSVGEVASTTGPGRRSFVTFTAADCIYGSKKLFLGVP